MLRLTYDKGTIVLSTAGRDPSPGGGVGDATLLGLRGDIPACLVWDEARGVYRAPAYNYSGVIKALSGRGMTLEDDVMHPLECGGFSGDIRLYDFQEEALNAWMRHRRGSIVIPTGGGKTVVAMRAIADLSVATLVIAPTLELVDQWASRLEEVLSVPVGKFTGSEKVLHPLTIATYDTAYLRVADIGNMFPFVVFDEVHHLAAPGYVRIAEMLPATMRMGLTATYEREDRLHHTLGHLIGEKVYEISVESLKGHHLSDYVTRRVKVSLTPAEKEEYDTHYKRYLAFIRSRGIRMRSHADFQKLVILSGRDPQGREALLSRLKARRIAMNSVSKFNELAKIFRRHPGERTIIFTEYNDLVHAISERFLIPGITHRTPKRERKDIFERFRSGEYRRIVTSKVLEEGVDIPEASVGVILSGSGSVREYRQRLGRILRKRKDKLAVLYEIVSGDTSEEGTSYRRHRKRLR